MRKPESWEHKADQAIREIRDANARDYAAANRAAVSDAVAGRGPDSTAAADETGVHAVFNISSAHIPAFCRAAPNERTPYKNCYDLGTHVVGDGRPSKRKTVDSALPLPSGKDYQKVYFAAIDLNGSGVRFYGDVCLVLKNALIAPDTLILDRNSYDLERSPLRERIYTDDDAGRIAARRKSEAEKLCGTWTDLPAIACLKVFDRLAPGLRRLTSGEIADGVLSDEDYIEVLWMRADTSACDSFRPGDLLEVRLFAADIALEERIRGRARGGPAASLAELLWRQRRRDAEIALRRVRVGVRVVTTSGRVKA